MGKSEHAVVVVGAGPTGMMLAAELQLAGVDVAIVERRMCGELDGSRAALLAAEGADYGVHSPKWLSRFTDMTRQAASYRAGRVLLAGDAAHVHPPQGGQGLNLGVQDAVNLGWKLALVAGGISSDSLLDSYQAERHPVAAGALRRALTLSALQAGDGRTAAIRDTMAELLRMEEPRRRYAGVLSGLDIAYDRGGGHPMLGRRIPDLDLVTAEGTVRVAWSRVVLLIVLCSSSSRMGDADRNGG